jgi:hypothetical protein
VDLKVVVIVTNHCGVTSCYSIVIGQYKFNILNMECGW